MAPTTVHTVFVPGMLCSARRYDPVLHTAWSYGAVTVADTRRDATIAATATRLLADALQRFVLVGLSMGGYVAHEVMRQASGRVRGLMLISTSARPDSDMQRRGRELQRDAVLDGRFDELLDAVAPLIADPANAADVQLQADWRAMAHEVGPEVFMAQLAEAMTRPDSRPGLPAITCPTAVVHGTGDRIITPDHAVETAAAILGATLTLVERAGYLLLQEQPAAARAALVALLDRVAAQV